MFIEPIDENIKSEWNEFAKKVNGFHELGQHTAYGRITFNIEPWELVLDTYMHQFTEERESTPFTRSRAPYANHDSFICEIYESTFSSEIAKIFGMQDVLMGDKKIDDKYIINVFQRNTNTLINERKYCT